jgi:hypothetical protein
VLFIGSCASIVASCHEIESQVIENMIAEPIEFDETIARDVRIRCRNSTLIGVDEGNKYICPILTDIGDLWPIQEVRREILEENLVGRDLEGLTNFFHIKIILCDRAITLAMFIGRIPIPHEDSMDIVSLSGGESAKIHEGEQTSCFKSKADTAESIPPDIAMPTVFFCERIFDVLIPVDTKSDFDFPIYSEKI